MYSEAIAIMDRNTLQFMVDEMRTEIETKDASILQMNDELALKNDELATKDEEIAMLKQKLAMLMSE